MGTVCLMIASYFLGWIVAHNVVANECRRAWEVLCWEYSVSLYKD